MEITELLIKLSPVVVAMGTLALSVRQDDIDKKLKTTRIGRVAFMITSGVTYFYYGNTFGLLVLLLVDILYTYGVEKLHDSYKAFSKRMDELSSSHADLLMEEIAKRGERIIELERDLQRYNTRESDRLQES